MSRTTLTGDSEVVASTNQVATQLGAEVVILGVEAGRYFGLNEVGARVWALVQKPIRVAALCSELESEFEVDPKELERDVLELLADMQDKGLIDVASALGAP